MAGPEPVDISLAVDENNSVTMTLTSQNTDVRVTNNPNEIIFSPTHQGAEYNVKFTITTSGFIFGSPPFIGITDPTSGPSPNQASFLHTDGVDQDQDPRTAQFNFKIHPEDNNSILIIDPTIVDNPPPGTSDDDGTPH